MDQAHEQVTDMSAAGGLVEVTVFPAQNGFLQNGFGGIVVRRRSRDVQEAGKLFPALLRVTDRVLSASVRDSGCRDLIVSEAVGA